jgi:hypothetical protein
MQSVAAPAPADRAGDAADMANTSHHTFNAARSDLPTVLIPIVTDARLKPILLFKPFCDIS